jgi:hypothetical protein
MYIIKDFLVCFFSKKFEVYIISEQRKKISKPYLVKVEDREIKNWELFDVPSPQDNQLNIFLYEEKEENQNLFNLWYVHV